MVEVPCTVPQEYLEYLGNLMCYTKQEIPQTLSYNDGGIQGEVDRIDGNRVFLTINTGSTE